MDTRPREGSLEAPTRHPIDWRNPDFYDEGALFSEMERVFDICHGCRRCVSLCQSFPTLFDLVDESDTMEVDGVARKDYWKVVDECFLCDLCYLTKCPYVPPHEWNVDFPHLMLRAKAQGFRKGRAKMRDRILTSTDAVGKSVGIPIVVNTVNSLNRNRGARKLLEASLGVHADAPVPRYHSDTARKQLKGHASPASTGVVEGTTGKVVLFTTCYGNYNEPEIVRDLVAIYEHNGIEVRLADRERCCGMPKLELGDLEAVDRAQQANIASLLPLVEAGYDIVAPVPSCVLMFKQELPLMYPDDTGVQRIREAMFDPFEYLYLRHKGGRLNTEFRNPLGKVAWQAACHQRVQNIGPRTRDVLELVPDTEVETIERCSGHDGTYAVKKETRDAAVKIGRPVARRVEQAQVRYYTSDCPMAGRHIASILDDGSEPLHPVTLLRRAYGI
ncbi:MAG: Fe-S oxidoreductase [Gammaproteobacteria bacterium]|jgi:Fe-S oxidoreductase|nr:Fe-S oxidoreductase [Gammaproteobacteria bacterium]